MLAKPTCGRGSFETLRVTTRSFQTVNSTRPPPKQRMEDGHNSFLHFSEFKKAGTYFQQESTLAGRCWFERKKCSTIFCFFQHPVEVSAAAGSCILKSFDSGSNCNDCISAYLLVIEDSEGACIGSTSYSGRLT